MRFLFAFVALLGFASASVIGPLVLGVNPGDAQAAAINAKVAVEDHARAIGEGQARAAEAAIQWNTEAVRTAAETSRNLHENAYWNNVAAGQNAVAAAQTQAATLSGIVAAKSALVAPLAAPYVAAPYYGTTFGLAAPYTAAIGLGYNGLGYNGLGYHAW